MATGWFGVVSPKAMMSVGGGCVGGGGSLVCCVVEDGRAVRLLVERTSDDVVLFKVNGTTTVEPRSSISSFAHIGFAEG